MRASHSLAKVPLEQEAMPAAARMRVLPIMTLLHNLTTVLRRSLSGCTISFACNYDPEATIDDGSCDFDLAWPSDAPTPVPAITILGNSADGSCERLSCLGCTDVNACDYDESATIAGACDYILRRLYG